MTYIENLAYFIKNHRGLYRSHIVLFVFGATTHSGQGPPH